MADRYVIFPGTAGNFVSTDDVNVLDCDSSWFAQGTGGLWTVGTPSTEQAKGDSPRSLKVTGGVSTAITPATDAADFSLFVYSAAGDDFDLNGGSPVTASPGVWTKVADAGNAGTYTVNAAGAGDYYIADVMLGAVSFTPSLRIVGTLFEEIEPSDMPIVFAGAGTPLTIGDGWAGNGYHYRRYDGPDNTAPIVASFEAEDIVLP